MYQAISKFSGRTLFKGSKQEISSFCDRMGIDRKSYKLKKVKE